MQLFCQQVYGITSLVSLSLLERLGFEFPYRRKNVGVDLSLLRNISSEQLQPRIIRYLNMVTFATKSFALIIK